MGTYLPGTGTLALVVWCWAGIPPVFYPPHVVVGLLTCSASLPLLPVWMNVASLNPWLLDFCMAQFSDESG